MGSNENPKILLREEVENLLRDILIKENLTDGELVIDAGSETGDGYASFMTKVDVISDEKKLHFIIKCLPKNLNTNDSIAFKLAFKTEIFFYEIAYPALLKFQKERNVEKPFNNVAKCYKSVLDPYEIIVLENIRYKNFDLFNRKGFMNDAHIKLLLETYGKYHAVSFAMQLQDKSQFEKMVNGVTHVFSSMADEHDMFLSLKTKMNDVAELFKTNKTIQDSLQNFKDNLINFVRLVEKRPEKSVISHGDPWCNNIMFKYQNINDRVKPDELRLLDFQLVTVTSPALDAAYSFYANASNDCLENLDDYIKFYYQTLKQHVEALGSNLADIYTYDDLLKDWKIYSKYGLAMCLLIVVTMLTSKEEAMDMTDMTTGENQMVNMFSRKLSNQNEINERYITLFSHFYDRGFLNSE